MKEAFVVAHFDPHGRIAKHLQRLLAHLAALSRDVVLVSTHLSDAGRNQVPAGIKVVERSNFGYDFWSYKIGIESLGEVSGLDRLTVLNSSFVVVDPERLVTAWQRAREGLDLVGLTYCNVERYHLQSYWVTFQGARVLGSSAFRSWWADMQPVSDKNQVVDRYEIGMSAHFEARGFRLGAVYVPDRRARFVALCRAFDAGFVQLNIPSTGPVALDPDLGDQCDPTLFGWDSLYRALGILKVKLVSQNTWGIDTSRLRALAREDPRLGELLEDVA